MNLDPEGGRASLPSWIRQCYAIDFYMMLHIGCETIKQQETLEYQVWYYRILVFHDKHRITCMHANEVVRNSEKSSVNSDVNEKSEWIKRIQLNIP